MPCQRPFHRVSGLARGVEPFLHKIQKMTADDVHNVYEMTRKEHAAHLKRTVDEMLELGFEGSMLKAS